MKIKVLIKHNNIKEYGNPTLNKFFYDKNKGSRLIMEDARSVKKYNIVKNKVNQSQKSIRRYVKQ